MIYSVVTVKFGNKYNSKFVNKLYSAIGYYSRGFYTTSQYKFYCYTDDPEGLSSGIEVISPKGNPTLKGVWNKLRLFDPDMPFEGNVIYLDLDTVVNDCIFTALQSNDWSMLTVCAAPWKDNKERYGRLSNYDVTIHSSVMTWLAGTNEDIWDWFNNYGYRDYYMRKYSGGMDRFLAHEDFKMKTFPPSFVQSKKYEDPWGATITTYEELDVQLDDLI